jgi:hypothetical protein
MITRFVLAAGLTLAATSARSDELRCTDPADRPSVMERAKDYRSCFVEIAVKNELNPVPRGEGASLVVALGACSGRSDYLVDALLKCLEGQPNAERRARAYSGAVAGAGTRDAERAIHRLHGRAR